MLPNCDPWDRCFFQYLTLIISVRFLYSVSGVPNMHSSDVSQAMLLMFQYVYPPMKNAAMLMAVKITNLR